LKDSTRSGLCATSAEEHSFDEWCELAGVRPRDAIDVVRELTSHGRRAAVELHSGVAQHTNGFYNVLAWMSVNMLLGNFDRKGGIIAASTFDVSGSKGKKFDLAAHPGKPATLWARSRGLAPPDYHPSSLPGLTPIRRSLARTRFAFIRVHSRFESSGLKRSTSNEALRPFSSLFVLFGKTGLSVNPVGSTDGFILCALGLASLRFLPPKPQCTPAGCRTIAGGDNPRKQHPSPPS
jgi:hypothetical protein